MAYDCCIPTSHLKILFHLCEASVGVEEVVWFSRGQLKCDGTHAEARFRHSAKWRVHLNQWGGVSSVNYWQPRCAHQLLLLVVMLDTPCPKIVWRILATHSICQFPLHFPSHASPCAIIFQLESNRNSFHYLSHPNQYHSSCIQLLDGRFAFLQQQKFLLYWNIKLFQNKSKSGCQLVFCQR